MKIDKNTVIGLLLMVAVMFGFMWYQGTTAQKRQAQQLAQAQTDAIAQQKSDSIRNIEEEKQARKVQEQLSDSASTLFQARQKNEGQTVIENELLKLTISNKGGQICRAELKDKSYKNQEGGQVVLFDGESNFNLLFDGKEENITTENLYFSPKSAGKNAVTMSLPVASGNIEIDYSLMPNSYIVKMDIRANGLSGFFSTKTNSFDIEWCEKMRQQEKGFDFENRYSTITWRTTDDDTDELSSAGADKEEDDFDDNMEWVAFKTQFFSQILIADKDFAPDEFSQKQFKRDAKTGYLKEYKAKMSTGFDPSGKQATALKMYLGPNKFSTLRENEKMMGDGRDLDLQSIVYLGWPLIKYINRFFMLYLFDWMTGWGINMGLVLILLTLIIKCTVYPLMRKSYLSSARMRVLKPKVDEIARKYPKQEDAMQKQQETMQLYSQYGVSPMGGCLPMLIQMPIWIALFNFIPNAIELRGQSFLWADDLSTYDDVINWGTHVWGIGDHLSLFCVLWCLSTVGNTWITMRQQRDTMTGEQAQQMKMMQWMSYIMPLIFFFSFNDYSSGLNLYYFFSGLLSILMMWFLRKTTDDGKLLAQLEKRYQERKASGSGVKKASSMMGRLQAMAEKQQEMLRQQQEEQQRRQQKR
ncbi:MAG: membrane protein insertase YidC [Bacteroidaceae bacterium]|nr:membrane protein insertase YidC [Bacteroidaceae bacterium]